MAYGKLYVVATPIGNLEDITFRAVRVLKEADIAAAEDTRRTRLLFTRYEIKTPLISCHKFNEAERLVFFIDELLGGKDVALVSDAGTPCVSDPGGRLVKRAASEGIETVPVCGACAAVAAVSVSGVETDSFAFLGFLPRGERRLIETIESAESSGVVSAAAFYESPKRIGKTLAIISEAFPDSRVCLCNDLTKKFERIYRGAPSEIVGELAANPDAGKGEYTCVLEYGPAVRSDRRVKDEASTDANCLSLEAALADEVAKKGVTLKQAVANVYEARDGAVPKKEIYSASLRLRKICGS